MADDPPRIAREKRTLQAMLALYCRAQHGTQGPLCDACQELWAYAEGRLDHCPFGVDKSTCAHCTVHCYKPQMRSRIQEVMRYAGPRMLWRHPLLALGHLWDRRRSGKPISRVD